MYISEGEITGVEVSLSAQMCTCRARFGGISGAAFP